MARADVKPMQPKLMPGGKPALVVMATPRRHPKDAKLDRSWLHLATNHHHLFGGYGRCGVTEITASCLKDILTDEGL